MTCQCYAILWCSILHLWSHIAFDRTVGFPGSIVTLHACMVARSMISLPFLFPAVFCHLFLLSWTTWRTIWNERNNMIIRDRYVHKPDNSVVDYILATSWTLGRRFAETVGPLEELYCCPLFCYFFLINKTDSLIFFSLKK